MARSKFHPWRVLRELPGGGQANVFVVTREDEGEVFVLKRLRNAERRGRFAHEVETMRALVDAGVPVPPVCDEGVTDDSDAKPFYVMPFYENGSLEAAVTDRRYVGDVRSGVEMAVAVAQGLAAVHSCGHAHRDIKPANVLLGDGGRPLLADFGLALNAEEQRAEDRLTSVTEAVGSRLYIAPENESGFNAEVDQRPADFYSYGKMVWALLAGRQPPAREQQLEHRFRLATLTGVDALARLDSLLEQLLITDPRARLVEWSTVEREFDALLAALGGTPTASGLKADDEVDAAARRYAGSAAYLMREKRQAETLRRMEHFPHLSRAAREGLEESAGEFVRVSQLAAGMELRRDSPGPSLDWLPLNALLAGVGRFGHSGWGDIPGTVASVGSSPLAAVDIAEQHEWDRMDPLIGLTLHAYIEDWNVWLLQVAVLYAGPGDVRVPPFLASFRRTEGPFRLGLGSAVDEARLAGARLGADGLLLFGRVLDVLAGGGTLTDPGAWAESTASCVEDSGSEMPPADDIQAIEQALVDFEQSVETPGDTNPQDAAFRLASRIARWVDKPLEVRIKSGHERDFNLRIRVAPVRWTAWHEEAANVAPTLHLFRAYLNSRGDVDRRREYVIGRPPDGQEPELTGATESGELLPLDDVEMRRFAKEAADMWGALRAEKDK